NRNYFIISISFLLLSASRPGTKSTGSYSYTDLLGRLNGGPRPAAGRLHAVVEKAPSSQQDSHADQEQPSQHIAQLRVGHYGAVGQRDRRIHGDEGRDQNQRQGDQLRLDHDPPRTPARIPREGD